MPEILATIGNFGTRGVADPNSTIASWTVRYCAALDLAADSPEVDSC